MKVLYFASLKAALGVSGETICATDGLTVGELRADLVKKYGSANFPQPILCAVNFEIATDDTLLTDSDEVGFYPPVTGG